MTLPPRIRAIVIAAETDPVALAPDAPDLTEMATRLQAAYQAQRLAYRLIHPHRTVADIAGDDEVGTRLIL